MKTLLWACVAWTIFCVLLATTCHAWEPTPSFIKYIQTVEGYSSTPYRSFEGGNDTIGYGHKRTPFDGVGHLTMGGATTLLVEDLKASYRRLKHTENLSNRQIEQLVDFSFNGCPERKFPKFYKAVRANNLVSMRQEYKRYCHGHELTGRNKAFAERYL